MRKATGKLVARSSASFLRLATIVVLLALLFTPLLVDGRGMDGFQLASGPATPVVD